MHTLLHASLLYYWAAYQLSERENVMLLISIWLL